MINEVRSDETIRPYGHVNFRFELIARLANLFGIVSRVCNDRTHFTTFKLLQKLITLWSIIPRTIRKFMSSDDWLSSMLAIIKQIHNIEHPTAKCLWGLRQHSMRVLR